MSSILHITAQKAHTILRQLDQRLAGISVAGDRAVALSDARDAMSEAYRGAAQVLNFRTREYLTHAIEGKRLNGTWDTRDAAALLDHVAGRVTADRDEYGRLAYQHSLGITDAIIYRTPNDIAPDWLRNRQYLFDVGDNTNRHALIDILRDNPVIDEESAERVRASLAGRDRFSPDDWKRVAQLALWRHEHQSDQAVHDIVTPMDIMDLAIVGYARGRAGYGDRGRVITFLQEQPASPAAWESAFRQLTDTVPDAWHRDEIRRMATLMLNAKNQPAQFRQMLETLMGTLVGRGAVAGVFLGAATGEIGPPSRSVLSVLERAFSMVNENITPTSILRQTREAVDRVVAQQEQAAGIIDLAALVLADMHSSRPILAGVPGYASQQNLLGSLLEGVVTAKPAAARATLDLAAHINRLENVTRPTPKEITADTTALLANAPARLDPDVYWQLATLVHADGLNEKRVLTAMSEDTGTAVLNELVRASLGNETPDSVVAVEEIARRLGVPDSARYATAYLQTEATSRHGELAAYSQLLEQAIFAATELRKDTAATGEIIDEVVQRLEHARGIIAGSINHDGYSTFPDFAEVGAAMADYELVKMLGGRA